jgi:uncharacterized protein YjbI with pentapeptide repeats
MNSTHTAMSHYTNFEQQGYCVERELGNNRLGGRVTYLATNLQTKQPVVIKQFQFAQNESSWQGYDAYHSEIKVLKSLNHPSIPRYLDSFETANGFCLVQEYKQAISLAQPRRFTPEEIKQIAIATLEVLVYLQQQNPPIIHRDIKPENILVNRSREIKVYLVDFGFARIGSGDVAASSVVKGTLGFMPPEQIFNRQLTRASDLYSLGATLVCLLTWTKSTEIGNLIDEETSRLNFRHLLSKVNPEFIDWLEKIVSPSLKSRYPDAANALRALRGISVTKTFVKPTSKSSQNAVVFLALGLVIFPTVTFVYSVKIVYQEFSIRWQVRHARKQLLETMHCQDCYLKQANFNNLSLEGYNLEQANLEEANLWRSNLAGSILKKANLKNANLEYANLENANLKEANLSEAHLAVASLENADLEGAFLERTNLSSSFLSGANLENASLDYANFGFAQLREVNFRNANLKGVFLKKAILHRADLSGANLENANLEYADLTGANLKGANLKNAKLKGAKMPDGKININ